MMLTRIRISSGNLKFTTDEPIVIGLVNNMPDAALQTTERQFRELLSVASRDRAVNLRLFSLPQLPRTEAAKSYISEHYEDIDELWTTRLDGLIVTGTEPRASALPHEPYWPTLTKLIDWAEEHTTSTIWSCLAAHAAVLHSDGISRRPFCEKLSGVFDCMKAADHPIMADAPSRWRVPHSRYNDLPVEALVSMGYRILSKLPDAGADMFVKEGKSLFVFLQGHPEYEPEALLREYRRDIRRFLAGERDNYPEMPRGYFDEQTAAAFGEFRQQAQRNRGTYLLLNFPASEPEMSLPYSWRELAMRLYANWLSYLVERRHLSFGLKKTDSTSASRSNRVE
jgi:homoserine O-succinyltransferase/O-acetyltransferase